MADLLRSFLSQSQLNATAKRLVCLNGMTRPDYIVRAYTKHTRNAGLKYSEILEKIQLGMDTFRDSSETYTKYYNTPMSEMPVFTTSSTSSTSSTCV